MTSLWPSAVASLDDSLVQLGESLADIEAAKSFDITRITEQLRIVAESAQSLRAMVCAELPEASWQNRTELDALIEEEMQKNLDAALMGGVLPQNVGADGSYRRL
jgi:hypothetical protein